MPLFDYICSDCSHKKEHYIRSLEEDKKACPKCGSQHYVRQMGKFRLKVEYSNIDDYNRQISKDVNEIYAKMGKEILHQDAGTMENIFGSSNVKDTYSESDE